MENLTAEYGVPGKAVYRRVQIDRRAGVVTFFRCHVPSRFISFGPDPEYRCRIDEIQGLCWRGIRGVGDVWEVVTPGGRARLPEAMTGDPVLQFLKDAVERAGHRLRWYWGQYPAAKIPLAVAAVAVGTPFGGLCLFVSELLPVWVFLGGILGAISLVAVIPTVTWWKGRSQW